MTLSARRLRTPEERVGMLPNACLPPPERPLEKLSEDELFLRALAGRDERAFAIVLDRSFPAMLRIALSHVADRAAAEDVIQESWLAALAGISRFEARSSVKTWLFHILRNIARSGADAMRGCVRSVTCSRSRATLRHSTPPTGSSMRRLRQRGRGTAHCG